MTGSLPMRSQGDPVVKICGARREIDLLAMRDAGADLAGLVFAPSKRRIEPARAREMAPVLLGQLPVVGVFVNAPLDEVNAIVDLVPLQFVQLSGQEDPEYVQGVHAPVIKVLHLRDSETADGVLARMDHYTDACAFLLDAWSSLGGGSGRQADWQLAAAIIEQAPRPVLLAGGLTPGSVAGALALTRADGVDVSSGVERDGWKDPDLMRDFVRAARSTTRRVSTQGHPSP